MGMMTSALKKIGLINNDAETSADARKKTREEAIERTMKRAEEKTGKPLNRFQQERKKAMGEEK
jgi:hypothetical protein